VTAAERSVFYDLFHAEKAAEMDMQSGGETAKDDEVDVSVAKTL
jgi:hypothetical protein